jgi:hypothetical protein
LGIDGLGQAEDAQIEREIGHIEELPAGATEDGSRRDYRAGRR